jgi:pimeloyl-ACP methyl ester carboxylesterase
MDEAGFETAHIAGNSLGGYLALQLAARGRARSVVALAPGGGSVEGDDSYRETLEFFPVLTSRCRLQAEAAAARGPYHATTRSRRACASGGEDLVSGVAIAGVDRRD